MVDFFISQLIPSFENSEGHKRFCWTQSQQGLLKSAFFIGYVLLQVHGGSLAEKFGTKKVLGIQCILLTAIFTLLTPLGTIHKPRGHIFGYLFPPPPFVVTFSK